MPYIEKNERDLLEYSLQDLFKSMKGIPLTAGTMNYLFTRLSHEYIKYKGLRYQSINDIVGAIEGCKLELTRQITNGYEDKKIKENGHVLDIGE